MTSYPDTRPTLFVAPSIVEQRLAENPDCCIWCGKTLDAPLARLGSTSCHDCPPTTPYPMRFTHP